MSRHFEIVCGDVGEAALGLPYNSLNDTFFKRPGATNKNRRGGPMCPPVPH